MGVRYYLTNAAAPVSPTGFAGTWTSTAQVTRAALGAQPAGTAATKAVTDTVTTNPNRVLALQFVGPAAVQAAAGASVRCRVVIGGLESVSAAGATLIVSAGLARGATMVSLGTSSANPGIGQTAQGLIVDFFTTSAAIQVGDRLVVEVGCAFLNSVTTTYTTTYNYGNTGTTELTSGSTSVTTQPSYVEFSGEFAAFTEAWGTAPGSPRRNVCTNPAGAVSTSGWSVSDATNMALSTASGVTGATRTTAIGLLNSTGTFVSSAELRFPSVAAVRGDTLSVVGKGRSIASGGSSSPTFLVQLLSGATVVSTQGSGSVQIAGASTNVWVDFKEVFVLNSPATIDAVRVVMQFSSFSSGHSYQFTDVRLEKVGQFAFTFADGDTSGWSWDGTAGLSSSSDVPAAVTVEPGRGMFATC